MKPRRPIRPAPAAALALVLSLCGALAAAEAAAARPDPRRIMHGIAAVAAPDGGSYVFFSAGTTPPPGGSWNHDVMLARWHPASGRLDVPATFIGRPEAQEPVSAARAANGNILLTFEDGWNADGAVTQRYGVYDATLAPVKPYPHEVERGGHSGHAAAVGDAFVVFYSDEWVQGGGVDDLGSGYGVYAKVYDAQGNEKLDIDVADQRREWWPMLAGGDSHALLVWQQFVPGRIDARLKAAVLDPATGSLTDPVVLHERLEYYNYNVAWLPDVHRFLLVASADGKGFAYLLDDAGHVTASLACMPATVREAGIAVAPTATAQPTAVAYTPAADGRLLQLRASGDALTLAGTLPTASGQRADWRPIGSLGLFTDAGQLVWLSLTDAGLVQYRFDPQMAQPATARDACR